MLMKCFYSFTLVLVCLFLLGACKPVPSGQKGTADADSASTMLLDYAKGFRVKTLANGVKLVDVADPQTDEDRADYCDDDASTLQLHCARCA